jgi:tRNA uridine 5-carbamoylmethylation protein Kti12
MALITLSGFGASGKSTRASELQKFLSEHQSKEVVIVNDENLHISRRVYDGRFDLFSSDSMEEGV